MDRECSKVSLSVAGGDRGHFKIAVFLRGSIMCRSLPWKIGASESLLIATIT